MGELMRSIGALLAVAIFFLPTPGVAQASIFEEIHGVRSSAMGGSHRGVGTSNDTLYLNPAGMAIGRRYAVEFHYGYSPFDKLTQLNVSAVDSKSGPVAGGVGYTHTRGDGDGVDANLHRIYVAAAYPISDAIAFGVTQRHIRGSFVHPVSGTRESVSLYTNDVGLIVRLAQGIGIGVSAQNIVRTNSPRLTPLTFAGGIAWDASPIIVAADVVVDSHDEDNRLYSYHVGAEYFLKNRFPLRLGFQRGPLIPKDGSAADAEQTENILSGGAAWVNTGGALSISAQRSLDRPKNWSIIAALKFFI